MKKFRKNPNQNLNQKRDHARAQGQNKNQNPDKISDKISDKIYGIHAVEALLRYSPEKVNTVFLSKDRQDERFKKIILLAKQHNIPVQMQKTEHKNSRLFSDALMQGVMAVCHPINTENTQAKYPETLAQLLEFLAENHLPALLLVLDSVQDPHNLGACIRTANASGCHAVIIPKDRAVSLNATVKKVASGAAEFTPVITVTNLAQTLKQLKEKGVWIYGMAGNATQCIYEEKFTHPTALVMGSESEGLRRLTQECCDEILSIPMAGKIESLNVSVAAGIALFEVVRQRKSALP